ncbi:uridine diphosphate-N-acetylglucosamine-binding protein YvcK [Chryseomicrobium palamuruense]|uniref:Gluconeogenesis factor n=1 Tax=Chryseomicrobium palamuruense TaxID=682973 RepID=A0ABV8UUY4_9BACL
MSKHSNHLKVVVLGGGTGLSTLLRGLKKLPVEITAIVTVADDGGSSGRLREDYDIPPPGDVRNVIAALSDVEPLVEAMFQYRFNHSKDLEGHSLGNLMLAALTDITGDFGNAVSEMSRVLNIHGKVLPAANQLVTLHAVYEDGTIVSGESKIPLEDKPIRSVMITPEKVKPLPEALQAIKQADLIVIGPGSLYTSILPNLLVEDIQIALRQSSALKVYMCNLMTQAGETDRYKASHHLQAILNHTGPGLVDVVLAADLDLPASIVSSYSEEYAVPVIVDEEKIRSLGVDIIKRDIAVVRNGSVRHNSEKVALWLVYEAMNYRK